MTDAVRPPRTIPPVEQVFPGVWSLPVPIPDNPLGYTLVYLLESSAGPVLVDTGWDSPASLAALESGVRTAGADLRDVYGVLVTHHHPDHHGLSGAVRARSGAWIAMHPAEAELVSQADLSEEWLLQTGAALLNAGAGEDDLARVPSPETLRGYLTTKPAIPNRLLDHGDAADVPGFDVRAIATPGHTPGHLCFVVAGYDLLLSGDHLLPRITPNIGLWDEAVQDDPLGDFLDSLRVLEFVHVTTVLPAHEYRFQGHVARIHELTEHHGRRFAAIEAQLQTGPASVWDIAAQMPWHRPWADIEPFMKRAGLAEAHAHLRYLERRDRIEVVADLTPVTYRLIG